MSVKKWRTQFSSYDAKKFGISFAGVGRTVQSDRDRFNPIFIMKQYRRDRDLSVFERRRGIYADISGLSHMSSYSDVINHFDAINELFMTLPATDREALGNNPMKFLDYANDPANLQWLADRGIIEPFKVNVDMSKSGLGDQPKPVESSSPTKEASAPDKSGV